MRGNGDAEVRRNQSSGSFRSVKINDECFGGDDDDVYDGVDLDLIGMRRVEDERGFERVGKAEAEVAEDRRGGEEGGVGRVAVDCWLA